MKHYIDLSDGAKNLLDEIDTIWMQRQDRLALKEFINVLVLLLWKYGG